MLPPTEQFLFDRDNLEPEAPQIPNYERMAILRDNEETGFLPVTKDELTEVFSLLAFQVEPGKTARHLNEILLHQQKADTDNPRNAVRSVTREYGAYAIQSWYDLAHLTSLDQEIQELVNPRVSLREDISEHHLGIPRLVRYIDLNQWVDDKGKTSLPFDPLRGWRQKHGEIDVRMIDPYIKGRREPEVEGHIQEVISGLGVGDARSLVKAAARDQSNRLEFWKRRLDESRQHALARPIADRILSSL